MIKKLEMMVVALVLAGCAIAPTSQPEGLTFIHLNDTYRVGTVEDGKRGGFSRIVTLARELDLDAAARRAMGATAGPEPEDAFG